MNLPRIPAIGAPLLLALVLLPACVSHDYVGRTYAPTDAVEVYFDAVELEGIDYEIMGHLRSQADEGTPSETIISEMTEQARRRGADGVIIADIEVVDRGAYTTVSGSQDFPTRYVRRSKDGRIVTYSPATGRYSETSQTYIARDKIIEGTLIRFRARPEAPDQPPAAQPR